MARSVNGSVGFARSSIQSFSIGSGADGSAVTPLDFGRGYAMFVVKCTSTANIAAASSLRVKVSYDDGDTEVDLYSAEDPSVRWSKGPLPTGANSFSFLLTSAFGAQKLRFILSVVTTGSVVFDVYGFDPTVDD